MSSSTVKATNYPSIKNGPVISLAEGNGSFNNVHFVAAIIVVPYVLKTVLPVVKYGGFKTYIFCVIIFGIPTAIGYWTINSLYGPRRNEKVTFPGKDIEEYITITDPELKKRYCGKEKIPMQLFYETYFDGKAEFNGMVRFYFFRGRVALMSIFR